MASTSSETPSLPGSNYDVFLSFRGEDTRHSFTDHLYQAFTLRGIEAFRDSEKLQLGQEIAAALIQAIENSQYAIVVFSKKYADSRWCLEELAKIVECNKNKRLTVVPVFYHVDPSDVRNQTGPFERDFDKHQKNDKIDREKIQKWKDAMREVGKLSGEHLLNHERSEAKCIQSIVGEVLNNLRNTAHTTELIGMESRVEKLKSYLTIKSNDVRIIGIWGTGGMDKNQLWMHDLLQEMGRYIVCQESQDPGERSRLWLFKDINDVLTENTGTKHIQCIGLEMHEPKNVDWNPEAFSKMRNLKLLKICGVQLMHDLKHLPNSLRILDWRGYPSKSLTSSFQSKSFENLKFLNLRESLKLIEFPDIEVPNLESLVLKDCINLRRIHPSIGIHKKLTILDLYGCKNLASLPSKFEMECLTELILCRCSKITKIPPSIGIHKKLTTLWLKECKNLTSLPSKFEMECLTLLDLCGCPKITKIPEFGRNMKRVSRLLLDGTAITTLPTSIEHLTALDWLCLRNCENLVHLPDTIFNLKLVGQVDLLGCSKLDRLPENLGNAKSLGRLDLRRTAIRKVPSSIGHLKNLYSLGLSPNKSRYELLPFYSMPTSPLPVDLIFSSLSLSPASSLKDLNLSDCNIKAIPNDIGSLFSLEELDLGGNDFVWLPESIIRLSKLKWMKLNNCTSLRSLPKLPLNIERVQAQGCISLEMLPNSLKPSDSLEPSLSLHNCFQLADNQSCIDWFISGIKKHLKLYPSLPREFLVKSNRITIPGSEIPEWFSHQSMGNVMEIKQPSHLYNEWMGAAAICIVFCAHVDFPPSFINYSLIGNGKSVFLCRITLLDQVSSDHLRLFHLTPQFFKEESHKLMWEGDVNGFSQFSIKMEIRNLGYYSKLKVKKWGFHMIYNKDMEDLDRTMVQYSNSSITPYDGIDVHNNFDNSSVAVECQKVKHSRDDYNGAGPSGEGSSNDIPNPERIKWHTETHGNSDSEESSEYKDCDEELSDRDESNDLEEDNDDSDEDDLEEDNDDSDESSVDRGKYSESDLDD